VTVLEAVIAIAVALLVVNAVMEGVSVRELKGVKDG